MQIQLTVTPPAQPRHTEDLTTNPAHPIVAISIVQYEEIYCYYGYSDRRMHTIFIRLPEDAAKRRKTNQSQSPSEAPPTSPAVENHPPGMGAQSWPVWKLINDKKDKTYLIES